VAAVVVLALGLPHFVTAMRASLLVAVAQEIAYNHHKGADVDVRSERYEVVQANLDRLGFSLLPTSGTLLTQYALEGGRYCSIHDRLAAQLKVCHRETGDRRSSRPETSRTRRSVTERMPRRPHLRPRP